MKNYGMKTWKMLQDFSNKALKKHYLTWIFSSEHLRKILKNNGLKHIIKEIQR